MRPQFTRVLALTAALLVLSTSLIALELFGAGFPMAGAGAVLLGGVAGVQIWKQHATIATLHGVRRNVAQLGARTSGASVTHQPPAPPAPAPAASPPASPQTDAPPPERTARFRRVGTYTPPKASYSDKEGRIAASVAPDPEAPFRLFAATNGFGSPDVTNVSARPVALVGSDALAEALAGEHTVQRLHPRFSTAELEHALPTVLIVEEDALGTGPWAGALDADGSALLTELRAAQAWIRRSGGINYVLPARGGSHLAASALRADAVLVQGPTLGGQNGPAVLLQTLAQRSEG